MSNIENKDNDGVEEQAATEIIEGNEKMQAEEGAKIKWHQRISGWIYPVIAALVLALIIKLFVVDIKTIQGSSMVPTYQSGDRVIVLRSWINHEYKHGDIVVFQSDIKSDEYYVKRIIGLPGDEIKIFMGQVFVNGDMIDENYLHGKPDTLVSEKSYWQLGDEEYFVMGDNRIPGGSLDSREFGPITTEQMVGKVLGIGVHESNDSH